VLQRVGAMQCSHPLDALAPGGVELDRATRSEVAHFLAFADAYRVACGADTEPLPVREVLVADWPANRALAELRRRHCVEFGSVGSLAHAVTEGGFCALYLAGTELDGRSLVDKAIMQACEIALEDERGHVAAALAAVERAELDRTAQTLLNELIREQWMLRLPMRRQQFSLSR
jgi:hypothetical protein